MKKLIGIIVCIPCSILLILITSADANENYVWSSSKNRNITAIGYQIGGFTLIGLDYELRVADYLGVHFGGGLVGGTFGLKIHTSPKKQSHFINLSVKDGGFGLMNAVAAEFGGRWVWNKNNNYGLHYQIGLMSILHIDEEFEDKMFGEDEEAPSTGLVGGLGFSW